jgi:diguanylate cyclase (GGDEF)-like protein
LIAHGQELGAVLLAFAPDRKLTPSEIRLGMQAADQIALAMLKAKLLEQAEQRAREAETLRLAGAAVVASLKQDETIERILEAMNQVVPYDSGAVLLPKNQNQEVTIVGARGFKYQIVGLGFHLNENTPSKIVFDTCKPHIIYDVQEHYDDFRHPPYDHIHGWMGIPLIIQDRIIGMLTLDSKEPGRFTPAHARLAQAFADQVAIALENARLFEETRRLATIDSLTEIYNRGHFMKLAQREFKRAVRYHKPLSLIMFDIDYFKQVNDTYGHITGDKTLQEIVQRCLDNLRSTDIMGRYGGEEFVILLPETALSKQVIAKEQQPETIQPARTVAERLRRAFSQEPLKIGWRTFTLTISLGVTEHSPDDKNIESLINRADQALLKAKSQGRNQVVICDPGENVA